MKSWFNFGLNHRELPPEDICSKKCSLKKLISLSLLNLRKTQQNLVGNCGDLPRKYSAYVETIGPKYPL